MTWNVTAPDGALAAAIAHKIDTKTKPLGALGQLEALARQVALVQQTLAPQLRQAHVLVFAADHGIAQAGVSQYPPEVTHQMVRNFAGGGAAINVFCRHNGLDLTIVDAGVRGSFANLGDFVRDEKIAEGTHNFAQGPAMTAAQCADALARGARLADERHAAGTNVLGVGEMGIGNTSAAAVLMHLLTGRPLAACVGRGTGLDAAGLARKLAVLTQAVGAHPGLNAADPRAVLATFGGFEIAQMAGALLRAAEHRMLLLIDGFIASAALLVAARLAPEILAYCVFCHESDEQGHRLLLAELGGRPLLRLGLRLGEGTGCALAYPLVQAAVNFLNEMASFESAGVSDDSGK
ncbi:nicotinate-nucleotide--dimethylbenzimidazole phosphoribosyltransferase [Hymenobacter sp. PAMC 26628]|uniref:nicotinate-nucleotide--dimethylbenzimidazole phosphoribosyltransferase n=1 Tax=Hymenobacter sp. PAMC 26628 TaxID=1484118 RepID=UPI0007701184|nr:nicotinate-nucleotide--dimethylbenzimidazole phosphoribosyltransferase [Hymenobacter sp. PAMC 26628]AMJ65293.1 nicotinate-nucleotide--dimethylbenzimidazole phosphoribosyltransferase [Hymenobacter sp. PAMC 26628]